MVSWKSEESCAQKNSGHSVPGFFFAQRKRMDRREAHKKFCQQRCNARARGIEWRLTFKDWLEWWGEDLDRRGPHINELCMQRFADQGPYALGNIRKGTPRDNGRTRAARLEPRVEEADGSDGPKEWELLSEDQMEIARMLGVRTVRGRRFIAEIDPQADFCPDEAGCQI